MKKIVLFLLLLSCIFSLLACSNEADDLVIVAENVRNAPAGEYNLQYSISDFEKYRESYRLVLTVNVYDENNVSIDVTNNRTVTLEKGKQYTVIIRLKGSVNGKEISKFKQFTIETVKADVNVYFYLKDGDIVSPYATSPISYGGSVLLSDVPEIPLFYAKQNEREGHIRSIISKKWVVYEEDGNYHDLTNDDLTDIKQDIFIYSFYEYEDTILNNTVTFVTNGGTEIAPVTGTINDVLRRPVSPTKEGFVFLGWCDDEELTSYHNWQLENNISTDITLYAKWAKDNSSEATPSSYFTFTLDNDDYNNPYYILSVKDVHRLSGELILPSCHDGLPVRELAIGAFSYSAITSAYIPCTYSMGMSRAFVSCQKLTRVEFEKENLLEKLNTNVFLDCPLLETVILPNHLTVLDEGCFSGCLCLEEIVLPDTLTVINTKAFYSCVSLTSITIPDSLSIIYSNAFDSCYSLSDVIFSENSSIREIASSAFNKTAVQTLILPYSLHDQVTLDDPKIEIEYFSPSSQTGSQPADD